MSKTPPQQLTAAGNQTPEAQRLHVPVLLEATLRLLAPKPGETYLDLTAGYGGHASAVLRGLGPDDAKGVTLVDRDAHAERELAPLVTSGARFIRSDFLSAAHQLIAEGQRFDMILADLGVSSPQVDRAERGFSFAKTGPLDMRMDQRQTRTLGDIVNHYAEGELARIIRDYGEEPKAKYIAAAIVSHRPFHTTTELAEVIASSIHGRPGRTHPATRTFQALRIELNNELEQIEELLPLVPKLLRPGGRVAIISFHSLEDRIVKRYFAEQFRMGYEAELRLLTKRPISGATDDVHNPRARSAKLRAAAKIKKERGLPPHADQGSQ